MLSAVGELPAADTATLRVYIIEVLQRIGFLNPKRRGYTWLTQILISKCQRLR
jgi:hypothetical protein